MSVPKRFTTG